MIQGLDDREVQDIGDVFLFISDIQSLLREALALANLTLDINIGQEVHFDLNDPVSPAGFAAAAFNVETETSRFISADFRLGQLAEDIADMAEHAGVGRWIGPGRTADRALIDINDFVDIVHAQNVPVPSWFFFRTVQFLGQAFMQDLFDQRRFARTRNSCHTDKGSQGE